MAKSFVTSEKTTFDNKHSKASNSIRRAWKPNLQKARILVSGKPKRVWVSTKTSKSSKVTRV